MDEIPYVDDRTWGVAGGLIAFDVALTVAAVSNGQLAHGSSPTLVAWDLAKGIAIVLLLISGSTRHRSPGLAGFGCLFLLIALVDGLAIHSPIAHWISDLVPWAVLDIRPADGQGIAELAVLLVLGLSAAIVVARLGGWQGLSATRQALWVLVIGLGFFAIAIDLVDHLTDLQGRWSMLEEGGEGVLLSLALAYSWQVWQRSLSMPESR